LPGHFARRTLDCDRNGLPCNRNKKVVGKECRVQLWNYADGKEYARFEDLAQPVMSVALSGDGRRILSSSPWDHVRLWDVKTRGQRGRFGVPLSGSHAVAISHDGRWGLFADHDPWVSLLDLDKGKQVQRFQGNHSKGRIRCVDFTWNGKQALCGSWGF